MTRLLRALFFSLFSIALFSLPVVMVVSQVDVVYAQDDEDDGGSQTPPNQQQQAESPTDRFIMNIDEQDAHQVMSNKTGFVDTFVNTMRSQLGVKLTAIKLTEPMVGEAMIGANEMVSGMLSNTYKSEESFRKQLQEVGPPGKYAEYRKCLAKNTAEKDVVSAISMCSGGDAASSSNEGVSPGGAEEGEEGEDDEEGEEDEENEDGEGGGEGEEAAKEVLRKTEKLSDKLALRIEDKAWRPIWVGTFRNWYGDGTFYTSQVDNRVILEKYEKTTACKIGFPKKPEICRARDSNNEEEKEQLYYANMRDDRLGFAGRLFEEQTLVFRELNHLMHQLCEYNQAQRAEIQSEGSFRGYDKDDGFDFWSAIEKDHFLRTTMRHNLSAGETFTFTRQLGKSLYEVFEIDAKGKDDSTTLDCNALKERVTHLRAKEYLQENIDSRDTDGSLRDIDRFYIQIARIIGGMRALNKVDDHLRTLYQMLAYEETEDLADLAVAIMNAELGSLEEIGTISNVDRRDVGSKVVMGNQHLLGELEKLKKKITQYVVEGESVRGSRILITQTRRSNRRP